MQERPKADVIERVRKLLAKTVENGASQAEAENAFKMASRIMAEHNLDMAEFDDKGNGQDDISWFEQDVFDTARWSLEMNLAYGIVSKYFFIEAHFAWVRLSDRRVKRLYFFGTPTNVEAAKFTFNALLDAFDGLFRDYRKRSRCDASERRIFIAGVAQGFAEKMDEERKAMEIERDLVQGKTSGSTALVLASVKDRTVQAYKEAHPDVKETRVTFAATRGSQSALDAGYAAGRSLNLNRALGGDDRKAIG